MENCSGRPGVVYNFNNQNLISYQNNFRAKYDIPFAIYFDFETAAPTDNCLDPEQKKMFVVSYVMIAVFYPGLGRVIIQRRFVHSLEQVTTLDHFSREQITFIEPHLTKMLKDMAFEVSKRRCKKSIGQIFYIESALVKKTLLKWFNQKFKQQFGKIDPMKKLTYESQYQINWQKDKCVICKFLLKLKPTNYKTSDDKMSFGDFVIRYEHKFPRNICTDEQLQNSHHLKNLENY